MNRSAQHAFEPEEIMAYLDGELEPHRASALAAHLDHCAECRSIAAGLRRVSDQLAAWEVEPSPRRLTEHVSKAVHEQARPKTGDTVGFKQGLLRGFFRGRGGPGPGHLAARWRRLFSPLHSCGFSKENSAEVSPHRRLNAPLLISVGFKAPTLSHPSHAHSPELLEIQMVFSMGLAITPKIHLPVMASPSPTSREKSSPTSRPFCLPHRNR